MMMFAIPTVSFEEPVDNVLSVRKLVVDVDNRGDFRPRAFLRKRRKRDSS